MCMLCLNVREIFECLMMNIESLGVNSFSSVTKYLMDNCTCAVSENGYFRKECCLQKCKSCTVSSSIARKCR